MSSWKSLAIAAAILVAGLRTAAAEPATVTVTLSDQDGRDMHIALSRKTVRAGPVEFKVTNTSKGLVHEFLITPWKGPSAKLPYDGKQSEVDEDRLSRLEGVEDMAPGAAATIRLVLAPGRYLVFCNQTDHYKMGMVESFTVTN